MSSDFLFIDNTTTTYPTYTTYTAGGLGPNPQIPNNQWKLKPFKKQITPSIGRITKELGSVLNDMEDIFHHIMMDRIWNIGADHAPGDVKWKTSTENDKTKLLIELPGYDKEQINISIKSNILSVEICDEKQEPTTKTIQFQLNPTYHDMTGDQLEATLKNGILTILIPSPPIKSIPVN